MSLEQPRGVGERGEKEERLRLHNEMQIALMRAYFGFEPSAEQATQWIKEQSSRFRTLITERPELLETFRDNPDTALAQAEEFLYAKSAARRA